MCRFIGAEKATEENPDGCSVALLCRTLGVNRSTYYAWLTARPAVAEPANAAARESARLGGQRGPGQRMRRAWDEPLQPLVEAGVREGG